jgi:integration host factor subunit alpha
MDTLTRRELLKTLIRLGLTRSLAKKTLNSFFNSITSALREGKKVSIVGLGNWEWKKRSPRMARNPKTGAAVQLEKRRVLVFKPSELLRRKLNQKP